MDISIDNNDLMQHIISVFDEQINTNQLKKNQFKKNQFKKNQWKNIQGGTFITAYKDKPFTSENVWCCMSNGNYNNGNVFDNSLESARICNTRDSRRTPSKPKYFEITVLAPRYRWRKIPNALTEKLLNRERERTIAIVDETDNKMAIYLNSVWSERPQWSATDLIENLKEKAGISFNELFHIYEIDCYSFNTHKKNNKGFFNNIKYDTVVKILQNIHGFYLKFQKPSTNQLAYMISSKKNKSYQIQYENEGANIRTLYDIITFHKVSALLKETYNIPSSNLIPKEPTYAYADVLLEIHGPSKKDEICQLTSKANSNNSKPIDMEFEKPQQILSLLNVIGELGSCNDINNTIVTKTIQDFFHIYFKNNKISSFDTKSSFGANWITQALSKALMFAPPMNDQIKTFINTKLVPILLEAFQEKKSITQEATAIHGLLSIPWNILSVNEINKCVDRWERLQMQWSLEDSINGGFRYYEKEAWYRTDVTSHIAEVLLAILTKDFSH